MMTEQRFDEIFNDVEMTLYRPNRISMEMGCPRYEVVALKSVDKEIVSLLGLTNNGFAFFLPIKDNGRERKPLKWLVEDMDGMDMFIGKDDERMEQKAIAKGSLLLCHVKTLASCISQDKSVERCKILNNKSGWVNCLMSYDDDDDKLSIDIEGGRHIGIGVDKLMGILVITESGAKNLAGWFGMEIGEVYDFVEILSIKFTNYKKEDKDERDQL
jgi:hypothetical protein